MDAWKMTLLQMTAQGVILAGSNYITHKDNRKLLLLERSEEDKREQNRMLMEIAILLAEKGQLTFSKTESILMVRRNGYV